ncbi:MAG: acyl-CoA thioesterase II [Pseudomonadota bacterium]
MDQQTRAATLLSLLDLETLDRDLFRGARDPDSIGRVFGGQVIAQALIAAGRTVDPERVTHSAHAYFVRPGNDNLPIIYHVERDRDGGSFSNRRVIAQQNGETILNMITSFQIEEEGLSHTAQSMPDVPPPEELRTDAEIIPELSHFPEFWRQFMVRPHGLEMRRTSIEPLMVRPMEPVQHFWFRFAGKQLVSAEINRAVLAYATDFGLLGTALLPHGIHWTNGRLRFASIDHALWFHQVPALNDWHLYTMESDWSGNGRGLGRGKIYSRDGVLVASTSQEGLLRLAPAEK